MQVLKTDSHGNYTEYITDTFFDKNVHVWMAYNYESNPIDACAVMMKYEDGRLYGPFVPPWVKIETLDKGETYQKCLKAVNEMYPDRWPNINELTAEIDTETWIRCHQFIQLTEKVVSQMDTKSLSDEERKILEEHLWELV